MRLSSTESFRLVDQDGPSLDRIHHLTPSNSSSGAQQFVDCKPLFQKTAASLDSDKRRIGSSENSLLSIKTLNFQPFKG